MQTRYISTFPVLPRLCTNCGILNDFDGLSMAIINMGDFMVSHSVLREHLKNFLTVG